jgi:hypothetical protein
MRAPWPRLGRPAGLLHANRARRIESRDSQQQQQQHGENCRPRNRQPRAAVVAAPATNPRRDWGSCEGEGEGGAGQRGGSCFSARVLLGARASRALSLAFSLLSLTPVGLLCAGCGSRGRAGGSFEWQSLVRG